MSLKHPPLRIALGEGPHESILNGNYSTAQVTSGWKSKIQNFKTTIMKFEPQKCFSSLAQ